jgi:predicted negative regulator of RcsB-dependent stress response
LNCCHGKSEYVELAEQFTRRIKDANTGLAALNIEEAEYAIIRGADDKATEHLELALTLTSDAAVREKAELLLSKLSVKLNDTEELAPTHGCSSCSQTTAPDIGIAEQTGSELSTLEYYELLILQLPAEIHMIYATLGEDFAGMYIAASHDNHLEALNKLELWFDGSHRDIYCYEKGKILHRLGRVAESETCLRDAIGENPENPLPHLSLALLLIEDNRLAESMQQLDQMIDADLFANQALMMRGEVFQMGGNFEAAIDQFVALLDTPIGSAAAEKLHVLLLESGRKADAAQIYKKYIGNKCKH